MRQKKKQHKQYIKMLSRYSDNGTKEDSPQGKNQRNEGRLLAIRWAKEGVIEK